jgi:hypothetical protein
MREGSRAIGRGDAPDYALDYALLEFIHTIAGFPAPPPEEEIIDVEAYVRETIRALC